VHLESRDLVGGLVTSTRQMYSMVTRSRMQSSALTGCSTMNMFTMVKPWLLMIHESQKDRQCCRPPYGAIKSRRRDRHSLAL